MNAAFAPVVCEAIELSWLSGAAPRRRLLLRGLWRRCRWCLAAAKKIGCCRDRTSDLMIFSHTRSQLRQTAPSKRQVCQNIRTFAERHQLLPAHARSRALRCVASFADQALAHASRRLSAPRPRAQGPPAAPPA